MTFRSRSVLYRQVRGMTGALVAVGQGKLSLPQLKDILETQDSLAFPQGMIAPAHGLFLTCVSVGWTTETQTCSFHNRHEKLPSTRISGDSST